MFKKIGIILTASLFLGSLPICAQSARSYRKPADSHNKSRNYHWLHADDRYLGFRLGYNSSSLSLRGCKGVDDKSISGMNLGLVYGIRLSYYNPIFFETGLIYSGKGARLKKSADQYSIRMHMLEVPFVFKYSIETNAPELSIQPFLGGFASLGVGGRYKDFQEREKHSTFTAGSFQNFDMGFRLGCGVQFQVFYFELSYDIGLINMARSNAYNLTKHINYDDFDDKIRTGNLSLSLGVNF